MTTPPQPVAIILGGTGLLGPYVQDALSHHYQVYSISRSAAADIQCDVTDPDAIRAVIERFTPDVVVHLVALTNVDQCEEEPDLADAINHQTVAHVVRALSPESHFIYISSDQVYPDLSGPHREGDEAPINVYARTKLEGEEAARQHPHSLILRTNLFGASRTAGRTSLSDFFIDAFTQQKELYLFEDSVFSPLHMDSLAHYIAQCAQHSHCGVYNLGSRAGMSKADFALALAAHLDLDYSCATRAQSSIVAARTPRPKDMRMDVSRIETLLGHSMPTLDEELKKL